MRARGTKVGQLDDEFVVLELTTLQWRLPVRNALSARTGVVRPGTGADSAVCCACPERENSPAKRDVVTAAISVWAKCIRWPLAVHVKAVVVDVERRTAACVTMMGRESVGRRRSQSCVGPCSRRKGLPVASGQSDDTLSVRQALRVCQREA